MSITILHHSGDFFKGFQEKNPMFHKKFTFGSPPHRFESKNLHYNLAKSDRMWYNSMLNENFTYLLKVY